MTVNLETQLNFRENYAEHFIAALFVDIIHTDSAFLGAPVATGHAGFLKAITFETKCFQIFK